MSDYSNYSVSDYDLASDEDNYAGAYGGYDDLYDDVIEEAGYDAWDIEDPEFDFDEERQLFEFDPFSEYFELKDNSDIVMMTYQALVQMAETTSDLLVAWKKRSTAANPEDEESLPEAGPDSFHQLGLNLYQLEQEDRDELRSYSVWKLMRVLGGKDEVLQLSAKVDQIMNYVKQVLINIMGSCLPSPLPYPVMSIILSNLLTTRGLNKLGHVAKDESVKLVEVKHMDKLYLAMADVFDHLKIVMFNIEPNTLATEPSMKEKKAKLEEEFELLDNILTDTDPILEGLECLEIGSDVEAGEDEWSEKIVKDM